MNHPNHPTLSQSSLQDFADCPRRFQLRYLEERAWPALETQPALEHERHMQRGAQFHRLVQQYFLGVPAEALSRQAAADDDLARWWPSFQTLPELEGLKARQVKAELNLSAPLGDYRLMAKYDLLILDPDGQSRIYDWKTSRKRPRRDWLAARLQTRVYPYLLARAGAQFNGGEAIAPEQIEMVYWFPEFPDQPAHFPYSAAQFAEDEAYLKRLIALIAALGEAPAPLTEDERHCRFCVYRSLCDRGVEAGPLDEAEGGWEPEAGFDLDLDFEQIAEIEF